MKCTCACTGAKRACPAQVTEEPNREAALVKALQRATGLKAELQRHVREATAAATGLSCSGEGSCGSCNRRVLGVRG